jgi:citrate synthase
MVNIDNVDQYDAMTEFWLTASEALDRLKVRPQTLYAYVSRGLVEATPQGDDSRRSLYRAADIETLAQRKARGRRTADVAANAIAWGEPVLSSAISTVLRGRLYYRGRDAAIMAETASLEETAHWLWSASPPPPRIAGPAAPVPAGNTIKARAFAALTHRAGLDPAAGGRSQDGLIRDADALMVALADAVAGAPGEGFLHDRLARSWDCDAAGADLIRRALVLLADHELNASAFTARVTASTGASLAASALAGLAALTGPLHGGYYLRVRPFLAEAATLGANRTVEAWLDQGLTMPGFGHALYPEGDPRARALLNRFEVPQPVDAAAQAVAQITGALPNIDFALVALSQALHLPDDAPFALFAVGRSAGWIAHALEQHRTGSLIRPRARYVGPAPEEP